MKESIASLDKARQRVQCENDELKDLLLRVSEKRIQNNERVHDINKDIEQEAGK